MKLLSLIALASAFALTGCNTVTGTRKAPDGSILTITSSRLLWASDGVDFGLQDTNGVTIKLAVQKSSPDLQAIQAVAQGVAAGIANGTVSAIK